jgi:DNA primase large subunit
VLVVVVKSAKINFSPNHFKIKFNTTQNSFNCYIYWIFTLLLGMDDKIIYYIILGVIYFLFNRLKKKPVEETEHDAPERPASTPRPISFEDLLREIAESKKPAQPSTPSAVPSSEYKEVPYTDYDDDLEEEEKSLEREPVRIDDDRVVLAYEEAKRQAFNRPSLEETATSEKVDTRFSRFKSFEKKERDSFLQDLVGELRQPKSLKKAVVLSEVLNRKHF